MACRGVYYAIDPETLGRVLAAKKLVRPERARRHASALLLPQIHRQGLR